MAKEKKYLIDNPVLMAEWDWEKNDELGLDITKLTCGMNIKVNWRCKKCGYSWITTINNRNRGTGCPQCSQIQRSIISFSFWISATCLSTISQCLSFYPPLSFVLSNSYL